MYPGVGTFVLIRPAQTFYERIRLCTVELWRHWATKYLIIRRWRTPISTRLSHGATSLSGANGWFPLHLDYESTFEQGASIAGTIAAFGALQGFLVDMAGANQFNITSLLDFARDEVRQAYDVDGNGKADLVACPSDWSCAEVIGFQLDAGDLRDHIDERGDAYSESMQDTVARFDSLVKTRFEEVPAIQHI